MRVRLLRTDDIDTTFAHAWDDLVERRGEHADCFDTSAWFTSTLRGHRDDPAGVRVAAVTGPAGAPVALLPLVRTGTDRWGVFAADRRPRSHLVLDPATDPAAAADALAACLAGNGIRELRLHRMPGRDPATRHLLAALRANGYTVAAREKSCDMLATVTGGWPGHRERFRGFDRYARRFATRITGQWELTLQEIGTPGATAPALVDAGFDVYADLFARSWKGPLDPRVAAARRNLLHRAAARGWVRLYILRIDGVPAAMHLWFRIGDVATWHSTAYDERFAALGVGTVVQWRAQERVFGGDPPRLVDLLPTRTPQKLRLAPERPPLWDIEAVRARPLLAATLPLRGLGRSVRLSAEQHLKARLRRRAGASAPTVRELRVHPDGTTGNPPHPREDRSHPQAGRDPHDPTPAVREVGADPALHRAIALATGDRGTDAVEAGRARGDTWWLVGERPHTLVHVTADHTVAAVAAIGGPGPGPDPDADAETGHDRGRAPAPGPGPGTSPPAPAETAIRHVATALESTLRVYLPDPGGRPGTPARVLPDPVPWPRSEAVAAGGPGRSAHPVGDGGPGRSVNPGGDGRPRTARNTPTNGRLPGPDPTEGLH